MFPCLNPEGKRATGRTKAPGVGNALSHADERNQKAGMVSESERQSEGLREGRQAVLADHITEGRKAGKVGNRGPRDPLKGRRGRA